MFDINGWELLLLGLLAVLVLGPERLPEYAAKLGRLVRQARTMADRAREQLKDEMGPDFSDVDWKAYDPRQYDPRKIVRDALNAPDDDASPVPATAAAGAAGAAGAVGAAGMAADKPLSTPRGHDPALPTPWDTEAT